MHELGRVIRDIGRKIGEDARLREIFALPLSLARRVREQRQRTLGAVVPAIEQQIGMSLTRIITDNGYHGPSAHVSCVN